MADPDIVLGNGGTTKIPFAQATLMGFDPQAIAEQAGSPVVLPSEKSARLKDPQIGALRDQGFPLGLAQAMNGNKLSFPMRLWIVDNSGSMNIADGTRLVQSRDNVQVVNCTRWSEMQQTVIFHAEMAALLQAPSVFRLLNHPGLAPGNQQFAIAESSTQNILRDLEIAKSIITKTRPAGVTPLAARIHEIRNNILQLTPTLRQNGTRVAVVIATDGLPTNQIGTCSTESKNAFVAALRSLEGLPVWVVIRLCTNENEVVEFYNALDHQLELSLEVLDDFFEEAKELYKFNKWINYALPLHRCREMGYHHRLFDLMDERKLTKDEVKDYFILLFGEEKMKSVPNMHTDWQGFMASAHRLLQGEPLQWNPILKTMTPWVDLKKLNKAHGKGNRCSIM